MKIFNTALILIIAMTNIASTEARPNGEDFGFGRRRALASDEQVLLSPEFDDCLDVIYDSVLYAYGGHVSYLAVPKNMDSNCPILMLDNGFSEGVDGFEHGGVLAPMLTVLDEVPKGVLLLDHIVTLETFLHAIHQLIPVNYVISENDYNLADNNCATYLLDFAKKVGLDYKDPNTITNIENYVGKSIASNDIIVGDIRKAYLEQNKGIFHKASFYVWNFAVGDEGMARALVRSNMNKMEEE